MIDKWIIYLIETLSNISLFLGVILFLLGVIVVITFVLTLICFYEDEEDLYEKTKKSLKLNIIWFLIVCGVSSFIPSKETMYLMFISDYVTEENIEAGTEAVKETFDYLIEGIDKVVNGDEE